MTPSKLSTISFEENSKISRDYATTAIKTLHSLRHQQEEPLRFIYMSGHFAIRSAAEIPKELQNHHLKEYGLLRVCTDDGGTPRSSTYHPLCRMMTRC